MIKRILFIIIILMLIFSINANEKMTLKKIKIEENTEPRIKIHPSQEYFNKIYKNYKPNTRANNFNKLLVLLVDFDTEDNPHTTGNGKFQLEKPDDYLITLGAPPHDRDYFEQQMEAVKFYYKAVSYESFQLDYDVYPKNKTAYSLPKPMAYYNPKDQGLFMYRIVEYFKEIFDIIENDTDKPNRFSDYEHYMVIHAGSDWQHDVYGDSYHDLPSFFITFGDEIEIKVDNGTHRIWSVANVPETISQDFRKRDRYTVDGNYYETIHQGYGVVNSVYVHEFGHSLGFADLYNTVNGYTSVGVFDIMDSGGSTLIGATGDIFMYNPPINAVQQVFYIEGTMPALPSVWSRLLVKEWEDYFITNNMLKDITDISQLNSLPIMASSAKRDDTEKDIPYFYRLRLSNDEYLLIENRNMDPDNRKSATNFHGALAGRVILYPSNPNVDTEDTLNYVYGDDYVYEYDLLLPSWVDANIAPEGGGILIWHIDDSIIGDRDSEYSNYNQNTVNGSYKNRGVKLVEADNRDDLGNPYSYFWSGSEWKYYFKNKPYFDEDGYFVYWTDDIHNIELSPTSKPPLTTNKGNPITWKIEIESRADRVMYFKVSNNFFENTTTIANIKDLSYISPTLLQNDERAIELVSQDTWYHYNFYNDDFVSEFTLEHYFILLMSDFEIIKTKIKENNYEEMLYVNDKKIILYYQQGYGEIDFDDKIIEQPLYFTRENKHYLTLSFNDYSALYEVSFDTDTYSYQKKLITKTQTKGKFAYNGYDNLYLLTDNNLKCFGFNSTSTDSVFTDIYSFNKKFSLYEPVIYTNTAITDTLIDTIFLMSDDAVVHSLKYDTVKQKCKYTEIFNVTLFCDKYKLDKEKPSQIALGINKDTCYLLFNTESTVFLLTEDGSFYPRFPLTIDNKLQSLANNYIINNNITDETIFLLQDKSQGLLAVDMLAKKRLEYSIYWNRADVVEKIEVNNNRFTMIYADKDDNVYYSERNDVNIIWGGFRNGASGNIENNKSPTTTNNNDFNVFVYPNPVNTNIANVRVIGTKSQVKIDIFNIAGQKVFSTISEDITDDFRDIRFITDKLASGVYFLTAENKGRKKQYKFAIVK